MTIVPTTAKSKDQGFGDECPGFSFVRSYRPRGPEIFHENFPSSPDDVFYNFISSIAAKTAADSSAAVFAFGRDGSGGAAVWHKPFVPPDRGKEGDITGTGDPGPASSQASRPSRDTEYRCPLSRPFGSQARRGPVGPRSRRPQKSGRRHVRFCCFHSGIPEPMLLHRSLWRCFRAVPKRGWSS